MILAALLAVQAPAPPLRHLVFSFTYSDARSITSHLSGFDNSGGNGEADFNQRDDAKGTIVIDVLEVARDKGMLLSVSESADNPANAAPPARCVVSATSASCEASAKINPEEVSLIRLVAPDFVDPDRIDANNHWKVDDGGRGSGSDYTVLANNGGALQIRESRVLGSGTAAAAVNGTIDYDLHREIVTGLNETVVDHPASGGSYVDDTVTFTAALQSDSLAH